MFRDKCLGCTFHDGPYHPDTPNARSDCTRGINAAIGEGCSDFAPDDYASCSNCYYCYRNGDRGYKCERGRNILRGFQRHCPDFAGWHQKTSGNSSGGCFLSTAICRSQGLPDDCEELQTLRCFRDNELLPNPQLARLVHIYYEESPKLVSKLTADAQTCRFLYENYITPLLAMIRAQEHTPRIVQKYQEMFDWVKKNV